MASDTFDTILCAGFGNMAGAVVRGWLRAGLNPASVTIYNPRPKDVPEGTTLVTDWPDTPFDAVVLGMKPYHLDEVAQPLAGAISDRTTVISLLAGVEVESLRRRFPQAGGWVRFMPNLAIALNKSPNALFGAGMDDTARACVTRLAEMGGAAEWLEAEAQFNLVTALAGSGPGFVYRFIDALARGAQSLGLEADQAERLAVQMVEGAAALAAQSPDSPGTLAARVASPGGMTQAGLDVLDEDGSLERVVTDCLRAARDRGEEMAREAAAKG